MRVLIVALSLPLCWAAHPQPTNLLKNPGLAAAAGEDAPAGWSFDDFRTGGKPLYDEGAGPEGAPTVGIQVGDPKERGAWRQRVVLNDVQVLHVSGWYRTEGVQPARSRGAVVRMTFVRAPGKWDVVSDPRHPLPPAEQWTRFEYVLPVPEQAAAVWPELFNFFAPGEVWWSKMQIREATAAEVVAETKAALDKPADANQVSYRPADGSRTSVNPPAFVWVPVPGARKYVLQYSPDPAFASADTVTVPDVDISVFTPHETLKPGRWHWRYGVESADGQVVYSKTRTFHVPPDARAYPRPRIEDVVARIPRTRPRLYFNPDRIAKVRAQQNEKQWAWLVRSAVASAEREIGKPLYPEPDWLPKAGQERSKAYLQSFRTMRPFTAGMERCALAYAVTGDRRFADEAKRRLLHFATWDPDGPTSVSHNDEAAMDIAMRGPRTYDWIYDTLTDEERAKCTEMFRVRLGQIYALHRRMPFESRPYSSHPGRMIGFLGEGAIGFMHEIPEAREWLDYNFKLLWSVYPAWGSDDGGWAEGISYWTAYMGMIFQYVALLDDYGVTFKDKPFFENTGYFGLYCAPPHSKVRPFGDGHEGRVGGGQGSLLYVLSTLYQNPYFRWYAEELQRGPSGPHAILTYDPDLQAKPPSDLPQARCFPHVGWVAMHSDMAHPKDEVFFMLKSSPYGSWSHSHASQNAFILNAFGEPLAISSGYYQRYGCPHHAQWTRQTKAHCSITVDGEGQVVRSKDANGFIADFADTDEFCYAVADATKAYGGRLKRFLRHVLFIRPATFVIYDNLESATESDYQWWLHAKSEMALDEEHQSVTIREGDGCAFVRLLVPTGLKFSQTDKFDVPPEVPTSPNQWHFTASTPGKSRTMRFVSVLLPSRAGDAASLPEVSLVEGEGAVAVTLMGAGRRDFVAFKTSPGAKIVKVGELQTDASVAALRWSEDRDEMLAAFARGGKIVRVGGRDLRPD
ncbi:MAG: DUF4962 domain-containing protein [Armatimonadota bacterium]